MKFNTDKVVNLLNENSPLALRSLIDYLFKRIELEQVKNELEPILIKFLQEKAPSVLDIKPFNIIEPEWALSSYICDALLVVLETDNIFTKLELLLMLRDDLLMRLKAPGSDPLDSVRFKIILADVVKNFNLDSLISYNWIERPLYIYKFPYHHTIDDGFYCLALHNIALFQTRYLPVDGFIHTPEDTVFHELGHVIQYRISNLNFDKQAMLPGSFDYILRCIYGNNMSFIKNNHGFELMADFFGIAATSFTPFEITVNTNLLYDPYDRALIKHYYELLCWNPETAINKSIWNGYRNDFKQEAQMIMLGNNKSSFAI